jgi:hypothetical protein
MFCSSCGKLVNENVKFCSACGHPLDAPYEAKGSEANASSAQTTAPPDKVSESNSKPRWPIAFWFLCVFLIVFLLRTFVGWLAIQAQVQIMGLPANASGMLDFQNNPSVAVATVGLLILMFGALVNLIQFTQRSRLFPLFLGINYALQIAYPLATTLVSATVNPSATEGLVAANVVGNLISSTILYVPWLVYLWKSAKARAIFAEA